ncbi:MAG: hypothetical protein U5L00_04475 [Desulfovermiculus sp.]|nr:hypothetical protein [Desulfovermiculus sp.]
MNVRRFTIKDFMRTISATVALLLVPAIPVFAAQVCNLTDQSTEEVLPNVILTWDSSFHCLKASDSGEYMITVKVSNDASSVQAVLIDNLELSHATPRPQGQAPDATAQATGLPITVGPGGAKVFKVTGGYELVETDEGKKANLHLRAHRIGANSGEPFELGINVHIRSPEASEIATSAARSSESTDNIARTIEAGTDHGISHFVEIEFEDSTSRAEGN